MKKTEDKNKKPDDDTFFSLVIHKYSVNIFGKKRGKKITTIKNESRIKKKKFMK